MCAISGILSKNIDEDKINFINNSILAQHHRGPDSSGTYKNNKVAFGHNRLAILDLSKNGYQPMISKSGRYMITFNGEIYNHLHLRRTYLGRTNWKGTSDTETLLELIDNTNLKETLNLIDGMYAFGLWDNKFQDLYLVRDKFGEKPLYYGKYKNSLIFGSELKIFEYYRNDLEINFESVSNYLNLSYIPSPETIYKNINKLNPGSFAKISSRLVNENYNGGFQEIKSNKDFKIEKFYNPIKNNFEIDQTKSFTNFKTLIKKNLESSVQQKMISDVPIGVFLSGGIDSSLIASIMKNYSSDKINTFTISSNNINFDESKRAKEISKYLGSSHHSLEVTKKDQLDIVDDLSSIYDEPFSDSSQIPSIILSKYTKKYVKVALTGDGADEIFYGYNRYIYSKSLWKKVKYLPKNIKKLISNIIYNIRPENWIHFQNFLNKFILTKNSLELLDEKMYKIGDSLNNSTNILENYMSHLMIWQKNENISNFKINNNLEKRLFSEIDVNENNFDYHVNMLDIKSYLPDDILVKTDRASMNFGLETRAPYLSSDLVKLSNQMPINYKTDKKKGKLILRELLKEYLPNKLTDGPKKGFSIPMNDWLNDSLKEWVEDYLNSRLVLNNNFINHQIVKKFWTDHKKGKKNYHKRLWNILVLLNWLDKKGFSI